VFCVDGCLPSTAPHQQEEQTVCLAPQRIRRQPPDLPAYLHQYKPAKSKAPKWADSKTTLKLHRTDAGHARACLVGTRSSSGLRVVSRMLGLSSDQGCRRAGESRRMEKVLRALQRGEEERDHHAAQPPHPTKPLPHTTTQRRSGTLA
jgi:hypothetical protein